MVKLFFIGVFKKQTDNEEATLIQSAIDVSSFGYFQRSNVDGFFKLAGRTVVSRLEPCTRTSIKQEVLKGNYLCHAFVKPDNTAVVIVSDGDYPNRAAHSIITKILEEYPQCNLELYLRKFQDPKEADSIMRLQAELDETKIILHSTINNLLKRGDKLDDLVAKSEDLSAQSKLFYKTARKTTRCCELF